MRTFQQITTLRAFVRAAREDGKMVGLVPTMGALHEGHLSLMRRAHGDCDITVASIFVNPTQFRQGEDYDAYPRDLSRDSKLAQEAGVDALFAPSVEVIYPEGSRTFVEVPSSAALWEGERRPGHFRGVATICTMLFNIVQPNRVYFGEKDYQQLKLIERLVADLHLPVTVIPMPTVREPDGLAMSSRNVNLSVEERKAAVVLSRALDAAEQYYQEGERRAQALETAMRAMLATQPAAEVEYAVVVDAETLEPMEMLESRAVALLAVRFGKTRLIDNRLLPAATGRNGKKALPTGEFAGNIPRET